MYIYERERAQQCNVRATEKRVRVVRRNGCAEEDESACKEGSCGKRGEEEG
jgi:hypothetical protein